MELYKKIIRLFSVLLGGSYRVATAAFTLILGVVITSALCTVLLYLFFARNLPDIRSLEDYHPPVTSEVFANDGTKVGEFWTECRMFLPYEKIPARLMQAFIDSEDDRFFEHQGIDMRAIFRAFFANLKSGEISQGGSTITQQVTRALLLSPERTLTRKVREVILSIRLERSLTKQQILTLYLNQIFLGNRSYGVAAAARNYFHKRVDDLTLAEIALIAGLPTAPARHSPIVNPDAARLRQLHVLKRMEENGHIRKEEKQAAMNEKLTIYSAGVDASFTDPQAAWFVEHVRRVLKERYGDEALYRGGLSVRTTLDLPMQRAAVQALLKGVLKLDRRQGFRGPTGHVDAGTLPEFLKKLDAERIGREWAVIWPPGENSVKDIPLPEVGKLVDAVVSGFEKSDMLINVGTLEGVIPRDGYKWARTYNNESAGYDDAHYVNEPRSILKVGDIIQVRRKENQIYDLSQDPLLQGSFYAIDPHTGHALAMVGGTDFGQSEFNRVLQALRQPGSSFKPFVYAAALDKGYTFSTTILDEQVKFQVANRGPKMFWSPKNYGGDYKGPTSFQGAITFSRNIPTVKILHDIGTHYVTAYVRKMGFTTPIEKYLSMALGSNDVVLSEMVQAYAVFANEGLPTPAVFITRVENAKGGVLEELPPMTPVSNIGTAETEKNETLSEDQEELMREAIKRVEPSDLNSELFTREQKTLSQDGLILTDLELKTLYGAVIPPKHVITPQTAYMMTELLKGVVDHGTATRVKELGRPVAGKTGTTNDETDAWFIGFTPDLAAGVWVGFDEPKSIGRGETGGKTAAPIFLDFMKVATANMEPRDFPKPTNFPKGDIARLSGGSSLFGSLPRFNLPGEMGGADRAGEFFEQDLEMLQKSTGE